MGAFTVQVIERTPDRLSIRADAIPLSQRWRAIRGISEWRLIVAGLGVMYLIWIFTNEGGIDYFFEADDVFAWLGVAFTIYAIITFFNLIGSVTKAGRTRLTLEVYKVEYDPSGSDTQSGPRKNVGSKASVFHWNGDQYDSNGNAAKGAEVQEIVRFDRPVFQVWLKRHYGNLLIADGFSTAAEAEEMADMINTWCDAAWAKIGAEAPEVPETEDGAVSP